MKEQRNYLNEGKIHDGEQLVQWSVPYFLL